MKTLKILSALLLGAALAAPQIASAQNENKHVQKVTVNVTSSGYSPSTVALKAGRPVHMTFVSRGGGGANDVVIPALAPGQKKMLDFTPRKGQAIAFSCSMKMFKGKVVGR
jgi:plastocyanin domain-containing protein